nr:hypothetical protein [Tanacetum cinerariifolium]
RNKPDIETLSMDDLYNNLKVYEAEFKGQSSSSSSSNSHNVAFVSFENTRSINETVNVAPDIPTASLKEQPSASSYDSNKSGDNERRVVPVETLASALVVQDGLGGYDWTYQVEEGPTDFVLMAHSSDSTNSSNSEEQPSASSYDVMFSFFASQLNTSYLDNEDLEQIDTNDLEDMDLKWNVAMITMRLKKFIKKIERNLNFNGKEPVGFDKTRFECNNCHRRGHFAR